MCCLLHGRVCYTVQYVYCHLPIWHSFLLFRQIWNTRKYIFSLVCVKRQLCEILCRDYFRYMFIWFRKSSDYLIVSREYLTLKFISNSVALRIIIIWRLWVFSLDVGQSLAGEMNPVLCWKTVWRIMSHEMKHPGESCFLLKNSPANHVTRNETPRGILFLVEKQSVESCHTKWNTQGNPVHCWKNSPANRVTRNETPMGILFLVEKIVRRIMSNEMKHSWESFSLLKKQSGESCPAKWNTKGNPVYCCETVWRIMSHEMKHSIWEAVIYNIS